MTASLVVPRYSLENRPALSDAAFTAAAAVASFASVVYVAGLVGWPWALVLHGVPPIAIAVRRRAPATVAAVVLLLDAAQWLLAVPFSGAQVSTLVAVYTVARLCPPRSSLTVVAATLVLVVASPVRQPFADAYSVVFASAAVILVYVLGRNVELRAAYLHALEEHARRLERDRDAAVDAAAAEERARIAREMHDVVAHHVTVMVVEAEGASWAIDDDPGSARTAVTSIADTGRAALAELRRLLGVLRDGHPADVAPQPGIAEVTDLVERFRSSGVDVRYLPPTVTVDLPSSLQVTVHRVLQESLTNVLKHAGPGVRADVSVRVGDDVRITVTDDGGSGTRPTDGSPGHGLTGIRERVGAFGGVVRAGHRPRGGFEVEAVIPRG